MGRWIVPILLGALVATGCGGATSCDGDAGELLIEVDAAELSLPGTSLEVCINDDCNSDTAPSSQVSVHYRGGPGGRPAAHQWHVSRQTGDAWETLAGGEIKTGCSADDSAFRVVVDGNAEATVTHSIIGS